MKTLLIFLIFPILCFAQNNYRTQPLETPFVAIIDSNDHWGVFDSSNMKIVVEPMYDLVFRKFNCWGVLKNDSITYYSPNFNEKVSIWFNAFYKTRKGYIYFEDKGRTTFKKIINSNFAKKGKYIYFLGNYLIDSFTVDLTLKFQKIKILNENSFCRNDSIFVFDYQNGQFLYNENAILNEEKQIENVPVNKINVNQIIPKDSFQTNFESIIFNENNYVLAKQNGFYNLWFNGNKLLTKDYKYLFYPNNKYPAEQFFCVKNENEFWQVYSIYGKKILETELDSVYNVDPLVYIVNGKVIFNKERKVKKIYARQVFLLDFRENDILYLNYGGKYGIWDFKNNMWLIKPKMDSISYFFNNTNNKLNNTVTVVYKGKLRLYNYETDYFYPIYPEKIQILIGHSLENKTCYEIIISNEKFIIYIDKNNLKIYN